MQGTIRALSVATLATLCAGAAVAAPDWSQVPARTVTLFYPGVTPIEWITNRPDHSGAKGLSKGQPCKGCHEEEVADLGATIVAGPELEPTPIKGKAGSIPVSVQAAFDATNVYLRLTWKPPAGGADRMDKDNQSKLAVMLENGTVDGASLSGCWETCHKDARTMPAASDDKHTKYVVDGNMAAGKFFDLMQWTSKGDKHDGYVADRRVMDGGTALIDAQGEMKGDQRVVTFTRRLSGTSAGDITLTAGGVYNIGFAIHDDYAWGRFHHVSLGYTLGLGSEADIQAMKQ